VATAVAQVLGVRAHRVQRVRGHDHPGQIQPIQQRGQHRYLVGLRVHVHLSQHDSVGVVERGQQMPLRRIAARWGRATRTTQRLAVHGHRPRTGPLVRGAGRGRGRTCLRPGPQQPVQLGGVQPLQGTADRGLRRRDRDAAEQIA
jgi:hypothetical protein